MNLEITGSKYHGFWFWGLLGGDGGKYGIQVLGSLRLNAGGVGGANEGVFGIHALGFPRLNAGGGVGWKRDGVGERGGNGKGKEGGRGDGKGGKGWDGVGNGGKGDGDMLGKVCHGNS